MRLLSAALSTLICATLLSSCDKYSTVDTSSTITEPYVLHMGGLEGMLARTNNAVVYKYLFLDDGSYTKDVLTVDSFIFHMRKGIYKANGNKSVYAPVKQGNFVTLNPVIFNTISGYCLNTSLFDAVHGDVYCCTNSGLAVSGGRGVQPFVADPAKGPMTQTTSIIQLDNGDLYAFNCLGTPRFFKRTQPNPITDPLKAWTALPNPTALTSSSNEYWMLASHGNNIFAIEKNGYVKPKYSKDEGSTWIGTQGLPDSTIINMAKSTKFNGAFYVAADSVGLFRFNPSNNKFEFSSGGLPPYIRIFDITCKRNKYRSGASKDYYFLASNLGLFMSENDAKDWVRVQQFAYTALD